MKKRIFAAVIALVLIIAVVPSVSAAGFSDVSKGIWYCNAAELCQQNGLMEGSGGKFMPDKTLSYEELFVLTARLHEVLNGGDGILPAAPSGYLTEKITKADGTAAYFGASDYCWLGTDGDEFYLGVPVDNAAKVGDKYIMTVVMDKTYKLTGVLREPVDEVSPCPGMESCRFMELVFAFPQAGIEDGFDFWDILDMCDTDGVVPSWVLPAAYYAANNGLGQIVPSMVGEDAYRGELVTIMAEAIPDGTLGAINSITEIYDIGTSDIWYGLDGETALELYNAGIITGTDAYGTFDCYKTLTRAEAATMLARILKPDLRQKFSINKPDFLIDYTLSDVPSGFAALVDSLSEYGSVMFFGDRLGVWDWETDDVRYYNFAGTEIYPAASDPLVQYCTECSACQGDYCQYFPEFGGAGYQDAAGRVVIAPCFTWVGGIYAGKAVVVTADDEFKLLTVK